MAESDELTRQAEELAEQADEMLTKAKQVREQEIKKHNQLAVRINAAYSKAILGQILSRYGIDVLKEILIQTQKDIRNTYPEAGQLPAEER